MTLPRRRSTIPGTNARVHRKTCSRFTRYSARHSSGVLVRKSPSPGQVVADVVDEHVDRPDRAGEVGDRGLVADVDHARRPRHRPRRGSPSTVSSARSGLISATTTRAPCAANVSEIARPIPPPPPVTSATRPARSGPGSWVTGRGW